MQAIRKRSGHQWQKIRARIIRRDGGLCQSCEAKGYVTSGAEVDHIIPITKGGTDDDDNLQLLCKTCHADKTREDLGQRVRVETGRDGWPVGGGLKV